MSQTKTITIGNSILGVSYPDGASEFSTPITLMSSYADSGELGINDSQTQTLNWNGIPISVSQFLSPTAGNYFAIDVIEETTSGTFTSELTASGEAKHVTWNGNKLEGTLINNRYYLTFEDTGLTAAATNTITLLGTPQATGVSNELIVNSSGFTTGDIETDPNTGELDLKSISLGGVPITVGRVGFKYYLIIKNRVNLSAHTVVQYKMNDDLQGDFNVLDAQGFSDGTSFAPTDSKSVAGKIDKALNHDGAADFIDTNSTFQSTFQDSFSINFWFNTTNPTPGPGPDYLCGASDAGGDEFSILYFNNLLIFTYTSGGVVADANGLATFTSGQWHMATLTLNKTSSTTMQIIGYFNGSPIFTLNKNAIDMSSFTMTRDFYIAAGNNGAAHDYSAGKIDNFCIFSKTLSQGDIDFLYNGTAGTEELSE